MEAFPPAFMQQGPNDEIVLGVQFATSREENLSAEWYQEGVRFLSSAIPSGKIRKTNFFPGNYVIALRTTGSIGYQYLYPFFSLEIGSEGSSKIIPLSSEDETRFPNQRLFLFLDFHIFPKGYPSDIYAENRKVSPAVVLGVTNEGMIERNLLGGTAEAALRWRIYYQGRLIQKETAEGMKSWLPSSGPGNYHLWMGVEGPSGFMPVSNLVEFPLFLNPSGRLTIIPEDEDHNGQPDFLAAPEVSPTTKGLYEVWEYELKHRLASYSRLRKIRVKGEEPATVEEP